MSLNNAANYVVTQYDTITGGANNILNNVSPGSANNFLISNGASSQPTFQIPTVATSVGTSAAPSGTSSMTYVNMGLGSSWSLTPTKYGNVKIKIDGGITGGASSQIYLILCYGTGAAPSNGTAATGTTVGTDLITQISGAIVIDGFEFGRTYIIQGLNPGTAYWFDVQMKNGSGFSAKILNVAFSAQEIIS
jgi:hypothetical protein